MKITALGPHLWLWFRLGRDFRHECLRFLNHWEGRSSLSNASPYQDIGHEAFIQFTLIDNFCSELCVANEIRRKSFAVRPVNGLVEGTEVNGMGRNRRRQRDLFRGIRPSKVLPRQIAMPHLPIEPSCFWLRILCMKAM